MNDNTAPFRLQVPEPSEIARHAGGAAGLPTFGVRWEPGARIASVGGLAFFAAFLKKTGLFGRLCEDFPICHRGNNARSRRDTIGTAVLAIPLGKARYVHINEPRHDDAARDLLGLDEIVAEDTVRKALKKPGEAQLDAWLSKHGREACEPLLACRCVIDIDNAVKPIHGRQEISTSRRLPRSGR